VQAAASQRAAGIVAMPLLLVAALACRSVPTAGHGDVAFRLLWEGESDVDLHVIDPAGDHLFFGLREVASGGLLDVDCNAGTDRLCARPIENVYWPVGTAPPGGYRVWAQAHSILPAEAPVAVSLLLLEGEEVVARTEGALAANGETLGPFAVEFPPAGPDGWRLTETGLDGDPLPWRDVECPDGFRFRLQSAPRTPRIEIDGEVVRLEAPVPGGSLYRAVGYALWAVGDELALTTPDGQHGGCREGSVQ